MRAYALLLTTTVQHPARSQLPRRAPRRCVGGFVHLPAPCWISTRAGLLTRRLDGFHRLPIERLRIVAGTRTGDGPAADLDRLDAFTHYTCPSLPHLIALLCRPTPSCIPPGTSLVVVDSFSALVNHAFPKLPETRPALDAKGSRGTLQLLHHETCTVKLT